MHRDSLPPSPGRPIVAAGLPTTANTASVRGSFLNGIEYKAAPGEADNVSLFIESGEVTIADLVLLAARS